MAIFFISCIKAKEVYNFNKTISEGTLRSNTLNLNEIHEWDRCLTISHGWMSFDMPPLRYYEQLSHFINMVKNILSNLLAMFVNTAKLKQFGFVFS